MGFDLMRLPSIRRYEGKRGWPLVFSWSVFWVAPFCDGWAAWVATATDATHHSASTPANDDKGTAAPDEDQCCADTADAFIVDSKPGPSSSSSEFAPVAGAAWTGSAVPAVPLASFRFAPVRRPQLPVFLNTLRLRI